MHKNYFVDSLTEIGNSEYLTKNYKDYITKYPKSQFIMIDIEKFKQINDNFGHQTGDIYLKQLARILKDSFQDSLVARIHGDEFVILTFLSEEEIEKVFYFVEKKIQLLMDKEEIPSLFRINAGSCLFDIHHIDDVSEKADFMMYMAKKEGKFYQAFSDKLWEEKEREKQLLSTFDYHIKYNTLSHFKRPFFSLDGDSTSIYQVCTNYPDGKGLMGEDNYELLRKNHRQYKLDNYNMVFLMDKLMQDGDKNMISVDYLSLIKNDNILSYLKELSTLEKNYFGNILISIKVYPETSKKEVLLLIRKIEELKNLGLKIRIDQVNNFTRDVFFQYTPIDYVGFDHRYIEEAMHDDGLNYFLLKKIDMIIHSPYSKTIPTFSHIDRKQEFDYIQSLGLDDGLATGEYYLKKKKC